LPQIHSVAHFEGFTSEQVQEQVGEKRIVLISVAQFDKAFFVLHVGAILHGSVIGGNSMRQFILKFLFFAVIPLVSCQSDLNDTWFEQFFTYSFEDDMEGWMVSATDLELGDTTIHWSITRSTDLASVGNTSLKLYLENWNDAGKIWIEQAYNISPYRKHEVIVEYDFGTRDYSSINNWIIIGGVSQKKPSTRDDLVFQESTGNGSDVDVGYKWLRKSYSFTLQPSSVERVHVMIGVWGTWESPRTYYIDNVKVTIREKS